jgi:hypothetical protein
MLEVVFGTLKYAGRCQIRASRRKRSREPLMLSKRFKVCLDILSD